MDRETIKIELQKKGYSLAMIATALGCSPVNVQQVVKGSSNSLRVAQAIAIALDLPIDKVFPDVYANAKVFDTSRQQRIESLQQRLAS